MNQFKALEIKTSALFNLVFANNTSLSWFLFFFLIMDLYFLMPAVITQIFNPITELVITKGIPTYPLIAEVKIKSFQYNLKL